MHLFHTQIHTWNTARDLNFRAVRSQPIAGAKETIKQLAVSYMVLGEKYYTPEAEEEATRQNRRERCE